MTTLPQADLAEEMTLTGLPLPITLRPLVAMSDDELLLFSRRNEAVRIERNSKGELEIMSPSGGEGSRWESRVIRELDLWAEQNGGASFSSSAGFRLPDGSVLMPDAAWISQVRWDALSDREQREFPPLCPDFVVEIQSETDSPPILRAKMTLWIANGAQLAWMIDPFSQTVAVYSADGSVEVLPARISSKPESRWRASGSTLRKCGNNEAGTTDSQHAAASKRLCKREVTMPATEILPPLPEILPALTISLPLDLLPARIRPDASFSDEDLFDFCQQNRLLRIEREENGDLLLMSPSGLEGDGINSEITTELKMWARLDGRGKSFGNNAGFTLPDDSMRSPDGAWMPWERWNALDPIERKRFGHVVPSFVIELRSESDSLPVLQAKMHLWIGNGVESAWLIDPQRKVVEVYQADEPVEVHENPTSVQGTGCVNGFELVMERVWG